MTRETLTALAQECHRASMCAWEGFAERNRGVDGPGMGCMIAQRAWKVALERLAECNLGGARIALKDLAAAERVYKQATHSRHVIAAIDEHTRSQET